MELEFIQDWEKNKSTLENYYKTTPQSEYHDYLVILKKTLELALPFFEFNLGSITEIDNGDYQGTKIFIIPLQTYQPSETETAVTYFGYGSCSGCDTLQGIHNYDDRMPSDEQVRDYMTLSLHLIQQLKWLYKD